MFLITDRRRVADLPAALDGALGGAPPGSVAVQLREKDLEDEALVALGARVAAVCRAHRARLFVNGPDAVAAAIGAEGVHLAEGAHGRLGGQHGRAGLSVHDAAGLERARRADFAFLSPVFPTPGKAEQGEELGVEGFRQLVAGARRAGNRVPVYALGGVTGGRAGACVAAGAAGVAVIGAVWGAADPGAALGELVAAVAGPAEAVPAGAVPGPE